MEVLYFAYQRITSLDDECLHSCSICGRADLASFLIASAWPEFLLVFVEVEEQLIQIPFNQLKTKLLLSKSMKYLYPHHHIVLLLKIHICFNKQSFSPSKLQYVHIVSEFLSSIHVF